MLNLRYTHVFDELDTEGERQSSAEQYIAAQLFDDWEERSLFWQGCRIITLVAEQFCPQEDPTIEIYTRLVQDVYDYLTGWHNALKDKEWPHEEEANQAGRDLCILVLSRLKPEWVEMKADE